ncbi:MAG: CDF family Co(II)/Ni(II) efflux transporter DmeF [Tildeniella nuda ZEHNDER 1965/U140]|jgi:cation diffusion facilitator family transporter|nr:CDF family Co(II)/Ni(II) efflux transporter DmeF [Tildeniella nuda ZEHNDER 1965/U140]
MHIHNLEQWEHTHDFSANQYEAEKSTQKVMLLTATTMIVEIIAGTLFGSMALLADGWHMATHTAAFGIAIFAYRYARRYSSSPKYTFGTGKVSALGGFASATALAVIALVMALESISRFFQPQVIQFNEAIGVAIFGLVINLISGFLLQEHHDHSHGHDHPHDYNLRAAYIHVLADALTSVFAIVALLAGKLLAWNWLDPAMGLVGAALITRWAFGLLQDTSSVLLDGASDRKTRAAVTSAIEEDSDSRVVDLHLWSVGQDHLAAIVSLVTHYPKAPEHYKKLLTNIEHLAHVVVEVNPCHGQPCAPSLSGSNRTT